MIRSHPLYSLEIHRGLIKDECQLLSTEKYKQMTIERWFPWKNRVRICVIGRIRACTSFINYKDMDGELLWYEGIPVYDSHKRELELCKKWLEAQQ